MRKACETHNNGQAVSEQNGDILTYFFENGEIKAQGKQVDGNMQGKWIFNKKEGYLWQIGYFDDNGKQHGSWTVFNQDGSVQKEKHFEHGKQVKL